MFVSTNSSGIIIAGGGSFGCYLANQLDASGEDVTVIDIDKDAFGRLSPDFAGSTVEGDASSIEVMRQAGISKAKAVIASTDNDNINLMIAQIACSIYEVPSVTAVVGDVRKFTANDACGFTILCPHIVMTQSVVMDLEKKEG